MDVGPYAETVRAALAGAAEVESPDVRAAAGRLQSALGPAMTLALMEMAADVAAEVTARLDGDVVEVRLRGGSPEIVVTPAPPAVEPPAPPPPPPPPPPSLQEEGGTARISLRMPESLKNRVEAAAAAEGTSVNTWLVRSVTSRLDTPSGGPGPGAAERTGRRMTGWAR